MLSSTWLVQKTPQKNVVRSQPGLRSGPGPGDLQLAVLRGAVVVRGPRQARDRRGVGQEDHGGEPGQRVEDVVGPERERDATDQGAEGEADVEC
jgi:hypothetical protein